jgi:Family of unknown function (DUF6886)
MSSLFHVSENADITEFLPRPSRVFPQLGLVVWAVADSHLVNYLLPRNCPRVTFQATSVTTLRDREHFNIHGSSRVVVVGSDWIERIEAAVLSVYELPSATFTLCDESAGYWVSRQAVKPIRRTLVSDILGAIERHRAKFRVVDDLLPMQEEVGSSTLDYSIIRMRNALK